MQKITVEIIQALVNESDIELSSTHAKLCIPIINRIYKKMSAGIKFSGIKVEKDTICDGHHRYIASMLAKLEIERIATTSTSATAVVNWKSVVFEEEDWDTPAKINMLNKQDADYNNTTVEKIIQMLK